MISETRKTCTAVRNLLGYAVYVRIENLEKTSKLLALLPTALLNLDTIFSPHAPSLRAFLLHGMSPDVCCLFDSDSEHAAKTVESDLIEAETAPCREA